MASTLEQRTLASSLTLNSVIPPTSTECRRNYGYHVSRTVGSNEHVIVCNVVMLIISTEALVLAI